MKDQLEHLFKQLEAKNEFYGSVLIKQNGKEILKKGYGFANLSYQIKNQNNTRHRIASVSKMFTAVAVLQLIEQEKISFDTKVVDFLGIEDSNINKEITVYHLLTHTSGIGDYFDEENSSDDDWANLWKDKPIYHMRKLEDYYQMFYNKEQKFKPGEQFSYAGAGYILLGMMIEKITKDTYFNYIRENIFRPLNMNDTDFIATDVPSYNVSEGYEKHGDQFIKNIYDITPEAASDGGATSTVNDLYLFMKGIREGSLFNKELTKSFLEPKELVTKGKEMNWLYGYGLWYITKEDEIIRYGHTGEETGISARVFYYPQLEIDVIILGNIGNSTGYLLWDVHDIITKEGY